MKLYLGITPKFWPWIEEPAIAEKMKEVNAGIIFSYWVFRKDIDFILSKGIADFFDWEGPVMIDSGAYSAYNSGVEINWLDYLSFLKRIEHNSNIVVVNLDVVGNHKKSQKNWNHLQQHLNYPIMPVFHYPDIIGYPKDIKYIGLGGMVRALKINEEGSVYDVAEWVTKLKVQKDYHGFGIGSPFNQIIFENHLDSVDWIGWRRNAALGNIYTPEGSRITKARKRPNDHKPMEKHLFEKYKPSFIDSCELIDKKGTEGWNWRALWNVWHFLIAQTFKDQMMQSRYVQSVQWRMNKFKYKDVKSLFKRRVKI